MCVTNNLGHKCKLHTIAYLLSMHKISTMISTRWQSHITALFLVQTIWFKLIDKKLKLKFLSKTKTCGIIHACAFIVFIYLYTFYMLPDPTFTIVIDLPGPILCAA